MWTKPQRGIDTMPPEAARMYVDGPWLQSVFFYFTAPWQWIAFHAVFLFCIAAHASILVGQTAAAQELLARAQGYAAESEDLEERRIQ